MSAETESTSREQTSSAAAAPEVASEESEPQKAEPQEDEDARYASQAAAAQPSPVAFEGGAAAPSELGGTTRRSEWVFLLLAVFFSLALVAIPAVFFTSIDLTAPAEEGGGGAPESSEEARELERLQLLRETRADALSKLYTYGPSEDVARYRIPIERAMRLTLRQDTSAAAPAASRPARGELAAPPGSALRSMTPR